MSWRALLEIVPTFRRPAAPPHWAPRAGQVTPAGPMLMTAAHGGRTYTRPYPASPDAVAADVLAEGIQ